MLGVSVSDKRVNASNFAQLKNLVAQDYFNSECTSCIDSRKRKSQQASARSQEMLCLPHGFINSDE